jgi:hypothetical protein
LLALLVLYPGRFRRDFGRDLAEAHFDRYRSERRRGRAASVAYVVTALADLCWGAAHEWKETGGNALRRRVSTADSIPGATMRFWRELPQDARYAVRLLARSPGFSLTVILTLALGVGANTAMFSVVHGILFRPLPFPHAERLASVWLTYPQWREREVLHQFWDAIQLAYPEYERLRDGTTSYEAVSIYRTDPMALTGIERPEVITVGSADDALPAVLGVGPSIGRWFSRAEAAPAGARLAVLTHAFWRTRFGGDPAVLGRPIRLDDEPYTVVGILPEGFRFTSLNAPPAPDVWIPVGSLGLPFDENNHAFEAVARLRADASFARAEEETALLLRGDRLPASRGARIVPRKEQEIAGVSTILFVFWGAAGLILLIACVNVANLLLGRCAERQPELALRHALGAERHRVLRLVLRQAATTVALGLAAGLAIAVPASRILEAFLFGVPRVDLVTYGGTVALMATVALAAALVPAWRATRVDPMEALRHE